MQVDTDAASTAILNVEQAVDAIGGEHPAITPAVRTRCQVADQQHKALLARLRNPNNHEGQAANLCFDLAVDWLANGFRAAHALKSSAMLTVTLWEVKREFANQKQEAVPDGISRLNHLMAGKLHHVKVLPDSLCDACLCLKVLQT